MTTRKRWSWCTTCDEVIELCDFGWEHLDVTYKKPAGQYKTSPGPPAGGFGEPAKIGHQAMPTLNGNGQVVWVSRAGKPL